MIYIDSLGIPAPKATISVFGANYGQPGTGYFSLSSCSKNLPGRKWEYKSKDVSHIVTEMRNEGWICTVGKDGYNAPLVSLTHKETQIELCRRKKQSTEKFQDAEDGFVRFGDLPEDGKSWNHRDDIPELGVSVFEAEFVSGSQGKEFRVLISNTFLEATYYALNDRPAYRVYGEVIGLGSDGEPVMKVKRSVKL